MTLLPGWNRSHQAVQNEVAGLLQTATETFLPPSVRYAAAEAATAIVNAWIATKTYDEWRAQMADIPNKRATSTQDRALRRVPTNTEVGRHE